MTNDDSLKPPTGTPPPSSLKGLTMALGIAPAEPGKDPLLGRDIGGVTIVRLIAEGGMGRVYEGKQEKPSRTVAVKVMRPGLTSPAVLKRFEYEAELLGRLQHPGIAHIYSVGVYRLDHASVPYFIMEYIADAETLTKYASDLKLPTRQRLDLFRNVCDAVAHGHQKGVIHRDLKPSNILVDGSGQPKVIDFGVARATDSDMALTTMQTDIGQLIGTLQYMSPEQFDADPNDIDIRSDVYALGVILYELLTGKPPYDVKKKAVYEVMRIVKEEDPTPLSSFNRALKGDVAVIAGKCLEKDRSRRYSSASELGSDVSRYLSGDPIAASPPGFLDGLVRLAKKHRATAAAVLVGLAGLVAAVISTSTFAVLAERQRREATAERDRANAAEERIKEQLCETNIRQINQLLVESADVQLGLKDRHEELWAAADKLAADTLRLFDGRPRPFELGFLLSYLDGAENVLVGHLSPLVWQTLTPDCSLLATGHQDGTVRLWDLDSQKKPVVLKGNHQRSLKGVFSRNGRRLAVAGEHGPPSKRTIIVWDATTGDPIQTLKGQRPMEHWSTFTDLSVSADGSKVVVIDQDGETTLWDVASTKPIRVLLPQVEDTVMQNCDWTIRFSADDSRIVTQKNTQVTSSIALWDVATGENVFSRDIPGNCWLSIETAVSNDGMRLAFVVAGQVHIVDASSGKDVDVLDLKECSDKGKPDDIRALVFDSSGTRIAVGRSGAVCVRDLKTNTASVLVVSDDQPARMSRGGTVPGMAVGFRGDGAVVIADQWNAKVLHWDPRKDMTSVLRAGISGEISSVAFSPDGARVATAGRDNTIRLWNADTGEEIAVIGEHEQAVSSVAFSPEGSTLASASHDATVSVWDLLSGEEKACLRGHSDVVSSVAFSPNGSRLLTGSLDGTARVWHVASGRQELFINGAGGLEDKPLREEFKWRAKEIQKQSKAVRCVAYSADGRHIATVSGDKQCRIWDAEIGNELAVIKSASEPIAFSPDGACLITGVYPRSAAIWQIPSGNALEDIHTRDVLAFAFSPDVRWIAGLRDSLGGGSLWMMQMGGPNLGFGVPQIARNGSRHGFYLTCFSFSPDGRQCVSGSCDGTARLWGRTSSELRLARTHVDETRRRLQPRVDAWFRRGPKAAPRGLEDAKSQLTQDEYREAANMVLKRCVAKHGDSPATK